MSEADNRRAVERLFEGLNAKHPEVMNEVFTDDSEMAYPQTDGTPEPGPIDLRPMARPNGSSGL
jgi:hypothetical protein